jgi:hypothetical protein
MARGPEFNVLNYLVTAVYSVVPRSEGTEKRTHQVQRKAVIDSETR